jgi:hypothetical protein
MFCLKILSQAQAAAIRPLIPAPEWKSIGAKRIPHEGEFGDDFSANKLSLPAAFQHFRRAGVEPGAFGINHHARPVPAHAQAVGPSGKDLRFQPGKIQLLAPRFPKFPRRQPRFARAALWLRLMGAKKKATPEFPNSDRPVAAGNSLTTFGGGD